MKYATAYSRIASLVVLLCYGLVRHAGAAGALDPELTFQAGDQKITFKRSELLKRSDARDDSAVANDVAYPGRAMSYKAVRATALFDGLKVADDAVIQFRCLDGFAAPIKARNAYSTSSLTKALPISRSKKPTSRGRR